MAVVPVLAFAVESDPTMEFQVFFDHTPGG